MIIKPKGAVTVPRSPRSLGSVLSWGREVGKCLQQLRDRSIDVRGGGFSTIKPDQICNFGELVTWTTGTGESAQTKTGISGGIIYCANQNWNIARHEMEIGADGNWLVSIPINVIANRDDANEIILPGIKSGTRPEDSAWVLTEIAEDGDTDYPINTEPTVDTGSGKIQIPIGTFTLTNGVAAFSPVTCGNVVVTQCGGTLGHTRG